MSGGKGGKQTVGYRYKLAYHAGLGVGPIDAFLEFRGGKKTAWAGRLAHTGIITINQPKLWGGDKDQGGIVSNVQILFGEADQPAPSYVKSVFGEQVPAWRGLSTLVFMGGLYGSMNPYPQAASYKIERITRGWFDGLSECWYPAKSTVMLGDDTGVREASLLVTGSGGMNNPIWAAATSFDPLIFTGLARSTGADLAGNAIPAYWGGVYSVLSGGHGRYSTDGMKTWITSGVPSGASGFWHCAGPAGFVAQKHAGYGGYIKASLIPAVYTDIPNTSFNDDGWPLQGHCAWTGQRYAFFGYYNGDTKWHLYLSTDLVSFELAYKANVGSGWYDIYDVAEHDGDIYVAGRWYDGATSRYQVRKGLPGVVVVERGGDSRPDCLVTSGERLCVKCYDGQILSSEDAFAEAVASGAIGSSGHARAMTYAGGRFYGLDASQGQCVSSPDLKTWSTPIFVGLSPPYEAIVGSGAGGGGGLNVINLAHALYYARTHSLIGREPVESMNDASWRAAADWYYAQGFGVCVEYDPSAESLADYEARLCKLGGCSITRSLTDGQLYIDIANGEYDLAALPILTDDDILDFSEQPTVLDSAVNSLQVKYFDPQKKEDVITPPVQILGLIDAFGTISQTNEYPEIPTGNLALRVAERDVRAAGTPTRAFDLVCTRKPRDWRPNTYFRLQAPKRGIADMVCIVGTNESGTLKSGAIKMTATQDIYSLSSSTFVEQEPGVDTRPNEMPVSITLQRAFEAPYIVLPPSLSSAALDALPAEAAFVVCVASDPAQSRDYTMTVADSGGPYTDVATGSWCPAATVAEGDATRVATGFTLVAGTLLAQVSTGSAALWGDEVVRVDAIDAVVGTVTLGRGCGDTVAATHEPGERIWFFGEDLSADMTEYVAGETVTVKLLTNTGSAQLEASAATPMPVSMQGRAGLPYPPGRVKIGGADWPLSVSGSFSVTWAHRNRVAQADQLIDGSVASVTPPANLRYGLRFTAIAADTTATLLIERLDIGAATATVDLLLPTDGDTVRMELWAIDENGASLQRHTHEFAFTMSPAPPASVIDAPAYQPYVPTWTIDGNGG